MIQFCCSYCNKPKQLHLSQLQQQSNIEWKYYCNRNASPTTRGFHLATTSLLQRKWEYGDSGLTISASGTFIIGDISGSATGPPLVTLNITIALLPQIPQEQGRARYYFHYKCTSRCLMVCKQIPPASITSLQRFPQGNITDTGGANATTLY